MPIANKISLYTFTLIVGLLITYWLTSLSLFGEGNPANAKSTSSEFKRAVQYEQAGKYPQAFKWYQRAADAGEAEAQYKLGYFYDQGQGVTQDTTRALEWYQRAADAGFAPAQQKLQQLQAEENQPTSSETTTPDKPSSEKPSSDQVLRFDKLSAPRFDKLSAPHGYRVAQAYRDVDKLSAPPPIEQLAGLRYLYAQGRYPEVIIQGSAIVNPSTSIKQLIKQAEQVQTAWVKASQLLEKGEFQAAYELAHVYDEPELQKLALRAQQTLDVTLKELDYLLAKGDYATVIARGEAKSQGHPEIKKRVDQAKNLEIVRGKIAQLVVEAQLPAAYQLANSLKTTPFQELAIEIKGQINQAESELAYLFAQGQYQALVTQGMTKVAWSRTIKELVDQAQKTLAHPQEPTEKTALAEAKPENLLPIPEGNVEPELSKEEIVVTEEPPPADEPVTIGKPSNKDNNSVSTSATDDPPLAKKVSSEQPIAIAVIGDSLADGIWGGVYRLLRNDKRFKVYRETVTASGLVRYDWQNRIKKLLQQKEIHIAIVLLGTNDGQALVSGKQRLSYQSEAWKQTYIERVNQLMGLLEESQVATFWVGLPTMRRTTMVKQVATLNQLYQEQADDFKAVHFLPTVPLTANEEGEYSAYLIDNTGRKKLLRASDGVHFTISGYDLLARYIIDNVYRNLPFLKKERHDS